MRSLYRRSMQRLYVACIALSGLAMVAITLIIPSGVFMRYVMNDPLQWPEPASVIMMVFFSFVGGAAVYRANLHIAVEALLKSVTASPMVKYRGPFVLGMPAEAWFDVGMMQKDLGLALELGRTTGVPLPSVALVNEMLNAARGLGLAAYDFAVVFDVLARLAGLPPSKKS